MELPEFPEQFHPEMLPGLRIALMSFVVREIQTDFMNHIPEIKQEIMQNNKNMNGIDAFLLADKQIKKRTSPYIQFILNVQGKMSVTLQNARDLEKVGSLDGAIALYEKLANDAYTSPTPHERLRIIYTKQKEYEKAINACKRYISILNEFHEFDPAFSNIHLVTNFQKNISNLETKLNK